MSPSESPTDDRSPLVEPTPGARTFTAERRVRWGDVDVTGWLRLDGLARLLQDVANDDVRDAGLDAGAPFVVRRTTVVVDRMPAAGEMVRLTTFCGGLGSRWAERRTSITGDRGGHVETASLWVCVDPTSGRPTRLDAPFLATYSDAAAGRTVRATLRHPGPPEDGARRRWPLRSSDLDPLGHVNNAATWEPVEDELARRGRRAGRATIEYRAAIEPDDTVEVVVVEGRIGRSTRGDASPDSLSLWLVVDGEVRASVEADLRGRGTGPDTDRSGDGGRGSAPDP